MKKLFSLLIAVLFVGTMWATDYDLILTLDVAKGAPSGSTSTALDNATLLSYLQGAAPATADITAASKTGDVYKGKGSGGSSIPQACLKIGKASGGGSVEFTIKNTYDNIAKVELIGYGWKTDTKVSVNSSSDWSPTTAQIKDTVSFVLSTASKTVNINVTSSAFCVTTIKLYKALAPTSPTISANDINFGTKYVPNGTSYTHDYELEVTGTELSNAISYVSSDNNKAKVSGTLTATGGTLAVKVTAPHGAFAETITLTSGSVEEVVNVTGTVYEKYSSPISVAAALTAYGESTLIVNDSLQVRGIVKSAATIYSNSATIVITDVNDSEKEFRLYAIKSLNKANFTSIENNVVRDASGNKFIVGDTVTAYGLVSVYDEKPQIASGGYLTAINRNKALINPEIIATPNSIALNTSDAAADQSVTLAYNDWEADATSASAKLYSDEACTSEITEGAWVSGFDFTDLTAPTFDVSENTVTSARTAYIKISASNASESAFVIIPITQAAAPTLDTYKPTALANIQSTDVVIVTMTKNSTTYALSTAAATGNNVGIVTVTVSDDNITAYSNAGIFWNIADSTTSGYMLYPDGETKRWLVQSGSGTNTRINTGEKKFWSINKSYLYNIDSGRHLGAVPGSSDWRCYAPTQQGDINSSISGQTLKFYVKDNGGATGFDNVEPSAKAVKVLRNGVLYIEKAGKTYNAQGQLVK